MLTVIRCSTAKTKISAQKQQRQSQTVQKLNTRVALQRERLITSEFVRTRRWTEQDITAPGAKQNQLSANRNSTNNKEHGGVPCSLVMHSIHLCRLSIFSDFLQCIERDTNNPLRYGQCGRNMNAAGYQRRTFDLSYALMLIHILRQPNL